MRVEIHQIADKELDSFINFPFELYKNDPYWVGELKADTKKLLRLNNVFWTKNERALFMAYQDGKAVGRIAAILNKEHNEYHHENSGFFGFLMSSMIEMLRLRFFRRQKIGSVPRG